MGLSAKHRRALDVIENALRGSDPRLTAMFAVFSRMNSDEQMPSIEQVRRSAAALFGWTRHRLAAAGGWLTVRPGRWVRAAIFLPLALGLVAASFALSPRSLGNARCVSMLAATRPVRPVRLNRTREQAQACRRISMSPFVFGK
jgi:hypothetical protein